MLLPGGALALPPPSSTLLWLPLSTLKYHTVSLQRRPHLPTEPHLPQAFAAQTRSGLHVGQGFTQISLPSVSSLRSDVCPFSLPCFSRDCHSRGRTALLPLAPSSFRLWPHLPVVSRIPWLVEVTLLTDVPGTGWRHDERVPVPSLLILHCCCLFLTDLVGFSAAAGSGGRSGHLHVGRVSLYSWTAVCCVGV